jgi:DMSO reductase family type II enzyme chaperone
VTGARARSELYRLFAAALEHPDTELRGEFARGGLRDALARLLPQVIPELSARLDGVALAAVPALEELAADYSALFDVGTSGKPPCPLHGGAYGGAERIAVMEEVVRFYDHFGLRVAQTTNEMPDQLGAELEFLHFLAFRQAELAEQGGDAAPYRRAERDFVERHPGRWVPEMRTRMEKTEASAFYRQVVVLLDEFLRRVPGEQSRTLEAGASAARG